MVAIPLDKINYIKVFKYANDLIFKEFYPKTKNVSYYLKSHSSVPLSVPLSVTKTLTLAITFALLQVELWYLACVFFVTRPFRWYHVVTLSVTFDLLQGQIYCRAGDHNSLNLLVIFNSTLYEIGSPTVKHL